jgi:Ca2+-binding EF-hand superfamily protein
MGNLLSFSVPPTADDRIVKAMQTFGMKQRDIAVLWSVFKKHDTKRLGVISTSVFYTDILFTQRTLFCDGLFDLIEGADPEAIDFGEFVAAITTFCFFEIPEILQFCFYVFDRDKNGFITQEEMRLFVDAMHCGNMSTNVQYALDNIRYENRAGKE